MYKALEKWTRPASWYGKEWPDCFVFLQQHRDSDSVTRSNFEAGLEHLGGESDTVFVIRESHWAVGWLETILIDQSNQEACESADAMLCALSDYPVLDDEHHSTLEFNEACESWRWLHLHDRMRLCARNGVSVFAARHEDFPEQCYEDLRT